MADYENLAIDRVGTDGRVGRIALNRPEKMNALSQELLYELNDALHAMEADDSIRSIIVSRRGPHVQRWLRSDAKRRQRRRRRGATPSRRRRKRPASAHGHSHPACSKLRTYILYFWNMAKITIAQVHGYAIAGGCELAMMADLVVPPRMRSWATPVCAAWAPRAPASIWPLVMGHAQGQGALLHRRERHRRRSRRGRHDQLRVAKGRIGRAHHRLPPIALP